MEGTRPASSLPGSRPGLPGGGPWLGREFRNPRRCVHRQLVARHPAALSVLALPFLVPIWRLWHFPGMNSPEPRDKACRELVSTLRWPKAFMNTQIFHAADSGDRCSWTWSGIPVAAGQGVGWNVRARDWKICQLWLHSACGVDQYKAYACVELASMLRLSTWVSTPWQ